MKMILHRGFVKNPRSTVRITLGDMTLKGEWVIGYYFQHRHRTECKNKKGNTVNQILKDMHCIIPYPSTNVIQYVEVIPETVCTYTEKTDKNFRPIFEGDFIKNIKTNQLYEVFWDDYNLQFFFVHGNNRKTFDDFNENEYKIVGNKFENAEVAE